MGTLTSLTFWILIAGWTLAACALALLIRALAADRAKGQRRCPKCWYDMSATSTLQCPECGRSHPSESKLHKARRRPLHALAALLLLAASLPFLLYPRAQTRGWLWPIPTTFLAAAWPLTKPESTLNQELLRRIGASSIRPTLTPSTPDPSDIIAAVRGAIRGIPGRRPPSQAWEEAYSQLLGTAAVQLRTINPTTVPEVNAVLAEIRDIPYRFEPHTRERWPAGIPISVDLGIKDWWGYARASAFESVRWTARGNEGERSGTIPNTTRSATINTGLTGDIELVLDVEVFQHPFAASRERRSMGRDVTTLHYSTVTILGDAAEVIESPELDASVSNALTLGFLSSSPSLMPTEIPIPNPDYTAIWGATPSPEATGISFGGRIEVFHNERAIATADMSWIVTGKPPTLLRSSSGSRSLFGGLEYKAESIEYFQVHRNQPGWHIRFTSDPSMGLAFLDAKKLWKGQVDIPWTSPPLLPPPTPSIPGQPSSAPTPPTPP